MFIKHTKYYALLLLSSSTLWVATPVSAYVGGSSNFSGFRGYPDHDCIKPYEPTKPYSFESQWDVDQWNSEVETYNYEWQTYVNCINEYVDAASNDIKRIREKANEAINDA